MTRGRRVVRDHHLELPPPVLERPARSRTGGVLERETCSRTRVTRTARSFQNSPCSGTGGVFWNSFAFQNRSTDRGSRCVSRPGRAVSHIPHSTTLARMPQTRTVDSRHCCSRRACRSPSRRRTCSCSARRCATSSPRPPRRHHARRASPSRSTPPMRPLPTQASGGCASPSVGWAPSGLSAEGLAPSCGANGAGQRGRRALTRARAASRSRMVRLRAAACGLWVVDIRESGAPVRV